MPKFIKSKYINACAFKQKGKKKNPQPIKNTHNQLKKKNTITIYRQ